MAAGVRFAGTLTVTAIANGDETAALTAFTATKTGATSVTLTATDTNWSVTAATLNTALNTNKILLAGNLTVTGIDSVYETSTLDDYTNANTGADTIKLSALDNNWSIAASTLTTILGDGVRLADALTVTGIANGNETAALTAYTSAETGATTVTLTASDTVWSVTAANLTTALAADVRFAGTMTVTDIANSDETAALTAFTATTTSATSVTLTATDAVWSIAAATLDTALAADVLFAGALTVTGITAETSALTNYTKAKTGATTNKLVASDGNWSVAAASLNTALNTSKILFAGDLTVTGIASIFETNTLDDYTNANTGADTIKLAADDGNWTVLASTLTTVAAT